MDTTPIRKYVAIEYTNGIPVYTKGKRELEAERIINELSIKHGTVGAKSEITETEKALIEDSASRGINYGFFWIDRPIIETDEMKEIFKLSNSFEDEFDRLKMFWDAQRKIGRNVHDLIHVEKDQLFLSYVDARRACSVLDKRYMDLKYLANPWLAFVTPKFKKVS
jgi:hypothetical protein